ncbi:hypothetical protein NDU88_004645 [Pleurodeles waltl]|uniref:Uncharacterized protein n=1 Tax=Pleurodeles waltl TaxID=8319 RepID=A0AAV7NP33_PLEWA|nr:hypothetical protein NDU88_004645 [Pleurodeles waltl]
MGSAPHTQRTALPTLLGTRGDSVKPLWILSKARSLQAYRTAVSSCPLIRLRGALLVAFGAPHPPTPNSRRCRDNSCTSVRCAEAGHLTGHEVRVSNDRLDPDVKKDHP